MPEDSLGAMKLGHCNRCGRVRSPAEAFPEPRGSGDNAAAGPLAWLRWAWTSVDGGDVCPDCQTPDERREAGWQIVKRLEAAIERSRSEGLAPRESEAELISHVLALRAELEATSAEGDDAEARGSDPSDPDGMDAGSGMDAESGLASRTDTTAAPSSSPHVDPLAATTRRHTEVAITGAFLTGHPLVIRLAEYSDLQRTLGDALRSPGWTVDRLEAEGGTYVSGGGFVKPMPLVIARREGDALVGELRYGLDGPDHARRVALARQAPGYELEPRRFRIDVYDLGVAVLTAWLDVSAPVTEEPSEMASTVKRLVLLRTMTHEAPIGEALQAIAHETVEEYGRAVRVALPDRVRHAWLGHDSTGGRLLWLHPVHVLEAQHPSKRAARQLAPVFHQTLTVDGGVFAPGVGWSAVVALAGSEGAATPVRLTQLHWAYYALYMDLDRGLLGVLNHARWSERPKFGELLKDADDAFGHYVRVMEARARLDSELGGLGGDELAIWQAISDVQRFDTLVEGVERKVEMLQRLTQRRADQAAADRSRHISESIGWLAAFTILTVAIAVIGYFFGAKPHVEDYDWVRIPVLALAVIGAGVLVWFAYRERAHRRNTP